MGENDPHAAAPPRDAHVASIAELVVLDLGVGMAAALASKMLSELGATVIRIEPEKGDPFVSIYPAYRFWRANASTASIDQLRGLMERADLCILGGEDYPGLDWHFDPAELAKLNPRAVILDLSAYVGGLKGPAVDILVQARTGFVYEQHADRPMHFAWPGPTYGAALLAVYAALVALLDRARGGTGQTVQISLQQGAAMWWTVFWMSADKPDATFFNTVVPKGVRQLIYQCSDGIYIQFATPTAAHMQRVYNILGIDREIDPRESTTYFDAAPQDYYGNCALYEEHFKRFTSEYLLTAFRDADIAAETVLAPGECWSDPQAVHNGIIETSPDGYGYIGLPINLRTVPTQDGTEVRTSPGAMLDGVRIIDFGHLIAGPFSSRLLADLGADVVKVEPLDAQTRRQNYRSYFAGNFGKRSICVDAKTPEGLEIIHRLVATANATHHNFRPGVAARLGLAPDQLRAVRPGITTLEASAYGQTGPKAFAPGYDMVFQAQCGLDMRSGGKDNVPAWARPWIVDYTTGALGAISLLSGLLEQTVSGRAIEAEVALFNSGLFLLSELIRMPTGDFQGAEITNHAQTGLHPAERLYRTTDGWIAIAARSSAMAQDFGRAFDLSLPDRSTWDEAVGSNLAASIGRLTTADALAKLNAAGVWAEPCIEDGFRALEAHDETRALITAVPDHRYQMVHCLGQLLRFSTPPLTERRAAPQPGEHTDAILQELHFTPEQIDDLRARRIVA